MAQAPTTNIKPLRKQVPCPQCKANSDRQQYYPFCSKRCADLDLGAWLNGDYRLSSSAEQE